MEAILVQFNVGTFGKFVNLTANECFVQQLANTLNLDEQICEDFADFTEALANCKSNGNIHATSVDQKNEFCVFRYENVYTILMDYVFAKDLSSATIDGVRLFSEGSQLAIGPLFAFAKKLQTVCEGGAKFGSTRSYAGRATNVMEPVPFQGGFKRGYNVR